MDEKTLYSFWEHDVSEQGPLQTEHGEQVSVISPGQRNCGSGPDYRGCIIEVDGEIHTGEVEIHVHERDWNQHGHDEDEAFDHVKLHLFLIPDSERVASEQIQRTVALENLFDSSDDQTKERLKHKTSQPLCPAGHKLIGSTDQIRNVLQRFELLGKKRITRRMKLLQKHIRTSQSRMEVLGQVLCECACLRRNQSPARTLTRGIRFHQLRRQFRDIRDPVQAQLFGEGILLRSAGLLPQEKCSETEWTVYCSRIESMASRRASEMKLDSWDCSDVRPVNTPYRRLAGFIGLFRRLFVEFSIDQLESVLFDQVRKIEVSSGLTDIATESDLLSYLIVKPGHVDSYWNQHSHPGQSFERPRALIGPHRAAIIWINGLLPYLLAVARTNNVRDMPNKLWQICQNGILPLGDRRSEKVSGQLFGSDATSVPKTAFTDQGQHELYRSFCRFGSNGCARCPINKQLGESNESTTSRS